MTEPRRFHDRPVPIASISNLYETEHGIVIEVRFKSKAAMDKAVAIEKAIGRMLMGDWPIWEDEQ
jgi:hypothetical protein